MSPLLLLLMDNTVFSIGGWPEPRRRQVAEKSYCDRPGGSMYRWHRLLQKRVLPGPKGYWEAFGIASMDAEKIKKALYLAWPLGGSFCCGVAVCWSTAIAACYHDGAPAVLWHQTRIPRQGSHYLTRVIAGQKSLRSPSEVNITL